ncbi:16S rRNA (guanine(966)-N(2))-methyltransferase RsmD [Acidovorax sp. GBBC 3334]|uniref:16S rRNA (guanine(966)-N(2))-methyltransferase RsmD n=1 Tax=Acidovorax sp. GBBC 3334 TaxID=2940496 RepID=UPI0023043407|nr:16S rRNA (guanine(966)-N(2))-methyltransferase RsmD [Acidovorax sp. GBBC 3334]MDA8453759.1 16S rRNA (guanine(966)-N(2))-methyltransferase RsmD [Acidovorax sp. GBBC 3334]
MSRAPSRPGASAPRSAARPARSSARAAAGPAAAPEPAHRGAGEVRIIGGQWKRTRLPVLQRPGLRPTPDRVRETLFNWLGQDLAGWHCVDAFAGTGVLGLEAASRGAAEVLLVEGDAGLAEQLRKSCDKLGAETVRVQRGDGLAALRQRAPRSTHLVLLDPPFEGGLFEAALAAAVPGLADDGWVYLEAPQAWDDAALAPFGLAVHRHLRAGAVHAHLLRKV